MNKEKRKILRKLRRYLRKYPEIRFGQALFNLNINEFEYHVEGEDNRMRDIYNDSDLKILDRMN